jgi:hypothetical protein
LVSLLPLFSDLDLSNYQIFSKDKLDSFRADENCIFTDHCFINGMKFYKIDEDTIEFAKEIIKDVLTLKYLDKICRELNISCEIAFVGETDNQHIAKKYGLGNNTQQVAMK